MVIVDQEVFPLKKYFKMQNTNLKVLHGHHTRCILCQWKNSSYKRKKHSHECSSFSSIVIEPGVIFVESGGCKLRLNSNLKSYWRQWWRQFKESTKLFSFAKIRQCKPREITCHRQTDRQTDSECVYTHIRFKIDWYSICLEHCTRMECIHKQ
jgi:hypothetical protein